MPRRGPREARRDQTIVGISGEVSFSKTEIEGLVDALSEVSAQQATEVRECMKPYIDRILRVLLGSGTEGTDKLKSVHIKQQTTGDKSPTISNVKGDVTIKY